MYSLALFIVELQTAKRRLVRIFEEPDGTSKERTRNAPNVQREEIGHPFDAHQNLSGVPRLTRTLISPKRWRLDGLSRG